MMCALNLSSRLMSLRMRSSRAGDGSMWRKVICSGSFMVQNPYLLQDEISIHPARPQTNPYSPQLDRASAASFSQQQRRLRSQGLAAAKAKVVIGMARRIHDPGAVPIRCAPPAPILVRPIGVENEPAALHFRIAQLLATETRHLVFVQWQIHMLRGIAVQIVDVERAAACGKIPGWIGVRTAQLPTAARTSRCFETARRAYASLVFGSVTP